MFACHFFPLFPPLSRAVWPHLAVAACLGPRSPPPPELAEVRFVNYHRPKLKICEAEQDAKSEIRRASV